MEGTLEQLIKTLSQVAPEVWRIVLRQVWAETIYGALSYAFFAILAILVLYWCWWVWKRIPMWNGSSEREMGQSFTIGLSIGTMFIWLLITLKVLFGFVLLRLLNPEWYAIETLSKLLPK